MIPILKGFAWTVFFLLAIIIGNIPALLDMVPVPVLVALFMSPWIYIATMAARANKTTK